MKHQLGIRVHPSNKKFVDAAASLTDANGKGLINSTAAVILEAIGRFEYSKGNFMSDESFIKNLMGTKKPCIKTIRNYIKYLQYLGLISFQLEDGLTVRRLSLPDKTVEPKSLREFRHSIGLTSYNYLTEESDQMDQDPTQNSNETDDFDSFFCSFSKEKFSPKPGKILPETLENFSPVSNKEELDTSVKRKLNNDLHQNNLLHDLEETEKEVLSVETGKVTHDVSGLDDWDIESSLNTEDKKEIDMSTKSNETQRVDKGRAGNPVSDEIANIFQSDPLPGRKRGTKAPRTARERRAVAMQDYNKGHCVNPAGKPNTKGRRLKPSLVRPVGDDGKITLAQLWAEYLKIFEEAFGDRDIILGLMSDTKERVGTFFDEIRQKFLDTTGRPVEYREVLEYIKWLHDPVRMAPMLRASKKAFVHPNQLQGVVYIQRFANERLAKATKSNAVVSDKVEHQQKKTQYLSAAFEDMRTCEGNDIEFAKCIARYGYVVFAEYLHDLLGMDASACKQKIINLMAGYLKTSSDRETAIEYMQLAWKRALANDSIECYVWADWKEACKDLLKLSIEKLEKEPIQNGG